MKTISIRTLVASTILAVASFTATAHSQTTKAKADIPFMFEYNGHTFASGQYSLNIRPDGVVEIGRGRHVQTSLAQAEALDATATMSSVVFHRAGGKYYLRQISIAGRNQSLGFMESRGEKQGLSYDIAGNASPASDVAVAIEAAH
jgi:hypothetical protein